MKTDLARLARLIGYPTEEIPADASSHALAVDGFKVTVSAVARVGGGEAGGGYRFSTALEVPEEGVVELAKYAAGRLLQEEATLAWDAESKAVVLWDEVEATVSDEALVRRFADFLDSCDWWRARAEELVERPVKFSEMVIVP